jgi:hypothetical protein
MASLIQYIVKYLYLYHKCEINRIYFSLAAAEHTTRDATNRPQFIGVATQGLGHREYRTV